MRKMAKGEKILMYEVVAILVPPVPDGETETLTVHSRAPSTCLRLRYRDPSTPPTV